MIKTVERYILKENLLTGKKPVLVGLSGGADSVALLAVLVRLGYTCIALHCNFHLRGEESDRDETFAREFALELGIPFYSTDFNTETYAREKKISIEMAARDLRYGWFEEKRRELDAQAIAVAHHRDDNVETLLINLIRGTGIHGMKGIRPKNGYIIRPLLPVGREDILQWLDEQKLSYITDSTNLSDEYTRNYIRLNLIPLLEKINPSVKETIARTAEHLSEAEQIYNEVIEKARKDIFPAEENLSIKELMQYPSPETILYELLKPYQFTRIVAKEIYNSLNKTSGKTFYSKTHRLVKDREYLLLTSLNNELITDSFVIHSEEDIHHLPVELSFSKIVYTDETCIEKGKHIAFLDKDKITFPLELRRMKPGDWFIPFGMKGKKKLSDYLNDRKWSLPDKENLWLLCSGENILWLVGERIDNRYRVYPATKQVLIVKKVN